jgi:hypothetical protein
VKLFGGDEFATVGGVIDFGRGLVGDLVVVVRPLISGQGDGVRELGGVLRVRGG